jgi:hypothetical protein
MMKKFLVFMFVFCVFGLNAQTIDDILKVSYQDYEGTARFASMGGAFGALGGDISSISVNPAGLAVFRKPHVSFTSSLNHIYNNSGIDGVNTASSHVRPGISSFGAVFIIENPYQAKTGWNFGVTYLKKTNFNRRTAVNNSLNANSIIDYFADKANEDTDFFAPDYLNSYNAFYNYSPLDWDAVMAYGTYLIDWNGDSYSEALNEGDRVYRQINSLTKGSSGEITFNIGMNHKDKFFAGILLGMTTLNYDREVVYREYAHENNTSDFDRLTYNTHLKIRGVGINCKIGIIYKPVQPVRFGLSFHAPDYFMSPYKKVDDSDYHAMDNLYFAALEVQYKTDNLLLKDGPGEEYYLFLERIKTPYKATGSVAFIIGKTGLVSMDCEYVDYSRIKLKGSDPANIFNDDIKQYFKNTVNLRFGAEIWIKNLALRAGYRHNQTPDKDYDLSRQTYSAGLGWRFGQFNIDMAYIQTNNTDYYTHYAGADRITENLKNRRLSLTLGWTFDSL